jgi:hypothetical protein
MLAQAWQFADNSIAELPSPADVGGFVIPVTEKFHKVFANVNGTYIEYDTNGDQKYNPTGILRIHIKGSHPQLGPSDGCAELFSGEGNCFAVGPAWLNEEGQWDYLSQVKLDKPIVRVLTTSINEVQFQVEFNIRNDFSVVETITVKDGEINIKDEIRGKNQKMKVVYPMLVSDGKNETSICITEHSIELALDTRKIQFAVEEADNDRLFRTGEVLNHRNGVVELGAVESKNKSITYTVKRP